MRLFKLITILLTLVALSGCGVVGDAERVCGKGQVAWIDEEGPEFACKGTNYPTHED